MKEDKSAKLLSSVIRRHNVQIRREEEERIQLHIKEKKALEEKLQKSIDKNAKLLEKLQKLDEKDY